MTTELDTSRVDLTAAYVDPDSATGAAKSFLRHPVTRFAVRRVVGLVCVVAIVAIVIFFLIQAVPGDPIKGAFGETMTGAQVDQLRHQFGLDKPVLAQLGSYLGGLTRGDLGESFQTFEPVSTIIKQRAGASLELAGAALLSVLLIGVTLGIAMGALTREGRHRKIEVGFASITTVLGSIPDYLLGTVLAFVIAVQLQWLPVTGSGTFDTLILPTIAIGLAPTMVLARIVRVETLNVLAQDYIRTARSKRLPALRIYGRHVLPNVLTAALTIAGLLFASVIGGAVVVETVFGRAGLGSALVDAVLSKNYPVVRGIALVLGLTVVVVNALIDLLLVALDPRSEMRQG